MSPKHDGPPSNLRSLTTRIDNLAREQGRSVRRIQRAVANTVVGQMLPPGVVKGGTAMKLRVGEAGSRFTPDLDVARAASLTLEDYLGELSDRLAEGWSGFTGTVTELDGLGKPTPLGSEFSQLGPAGAAWIYDSERHSCVGGLRDARSASPG